MCGADTPTSISADLPALVASCLSLRIVTHEYFGEGGVKGLDVLRKVLSIGELELLLTLFSTDATVI